MYIPLLPLCLTSHWYTAVLQNPTILDCVCLDNPELLKDLLADICKHAEATKPPRRGIFGFKKKEDEAAAGAAPALKLQTLLELKGVLGLTALHYAATMNREQCVEVLLEAASKLRTPLDFIDSVEGGKFTPLACAIRNQNFDIAKVGTATPAMFWQCTQSHW